MLQVLHRDVAQELQGEVNVSGRDPAHLVAYVQVSDGRGRARC